MSIFVIINEWETDRETTGSEPVDWIYWATEEKAWEYLRDIAAIHEYELDRDDHSFSPPTPSPGIQYEEYYIQELTPSN